MHTASEPLSRAACQQRTDTPTATKQALPRAMPRDEGRDSAWETGEARPFTRGPGRASAKSAVPLGP